jgi:NAD-dependent SIR2 family protein deacetylase
VFFGEPLADRFARLAAQDLSRCELLVVMGTSLVVYPFAGLVKMVPGTLYV